MDEVWVDFLLKSEIINPRIAILEASNGLPPTAANNWAQIGKASRATQSSARRRGARTPKWPEQNFKVKVKI